jgi:glycosyltransferase involved in cell wall biosynthesis
MPRFANMLKTDYKSRGHAVIMISPGDKIHRIFAGTSLAKWAGYIDQYIIFPSRVRKMLRGIPSDALFVFCDQALGPWIPLVKSRPHVVHVHDLLALRSALGGFKENPISFTGRIYQRYIRAGFRAARHFISISYKTRDDLHAFGLVDPISSDVVHNGLNYPYSPMPSEEAARVLREAGLPVPASGERILLSLGGSLWYKNQQGVISIYAHYVASETAPLALWCIGPPPDARTLEELSKVADRGKVYFFRDISNRTLHAAYSYAGAFLFPSLAEGFGWPLVEAQACGCPVITTNEAPMTEAAGDAAVYLPRLRYGEDVDSWAEVGARALRLLLAETAQERLTRSQRGLKWAMRFDADRAISAYLAIYEKILAATRSSHEIKFA